LPARDDGGGLAAHVGVALLVLAIARWLAGVPPLCAAFAALLFAVLPAHAEAVAWISRGRPDVVATFFTLLSFLGCGLARLASGRRRWRWQVVSVSSFALASLGKESMITCLLLLPAPTLLHGLDGAKVGGPLTWIGAAVIAAFVLLGL
jgi:hypothetical protein